MTSRPLRIHEELLLLALRDKEGTLHSGAWFQQALAGGVLAELLNSDAVRIQRDGKHDVLAIVHGRHLEDPLLDACLATIRDSSKLRPVQHWANMIAVRGDLMPRTGKGLCSLGVLRTDEKKVLWIFSRKVYPKVDAKPEAALLKRLDRAIFGSSARVDPRTASLIAIADRTGLLRANFDHTRLKAKKSRLEQIAAGDCAGDATQGTIQAQQAAMLMAVCVPLIIMPMVSGN